MSTWIYLVLPIPGRMGMPHAFSTKTLADEYIFANPHYYLAILKIDGERE
jgi:hypothetical protein